jgi:hypothetical protein
MSVTCRQALGALILGTSSACASVLGVDDIGYGGGQTPDATADAVVSDATSDAAASDHAPDGAIVDGAATDATVDVTVDATADASSDAPPVTRALVFITSQLTEGGKIGGHQKADALCNTLAGKVGLPGQFVAWLSDSSSNAIDRLGNAKGPWFLTDPTRDAMVFANPIDLVSIPPRVGIKNTEDGGIQNDVIVWTGTTNAGTLKVSANASCGDWVDGSLGGRCGQNVNTNGWTDIVDEDCVVPHAIYCFQR